ncbi:APC family permease [Legionella sp. km772]|uniref:APC family permease n=1 Tax=Legionella sp. km772 TaxID=2498111 RepID=UPI000F8D250F|nr:APC family permease [Legionella sp. km772]RUR12420.1 APC family permease [Legionella sp. km772]
MNQEQKLAANSLSIGESIVMGLAGSAPAFSLAAATTSLVGAVGVLAPASVLYCGFIMFGITLAFIHLNRIKVNAGAAYAWVREIFGVSMGFFAGWALLVASALFMVAGSIPAATATLLLIAPRWVNTMPVVTTVAALWVSLIAVVTCKGIKPASYLQFLMTGVEVLILIAIIISGLWQLHTHSLHDFSWSWFNLGNFSFRTFTNGALVSIFLYWGWDVTLNLNEETKKAMHTPGWGAFWSVLLIIALLVSFVVTALVVLSDAEIMKAGTNIIFVIAEKLFPKPWSYLAILCVMLSTIGTLETSMLQFTRTLFAKGRDGVLHPRYAQLHSTRNTPWVATLVIWLFGLLLLLFSSFSFTVYTLMNDFVNAVSFQVAFYYSLTGFACAWHYQKTWTLLSELLIYVVWPIFSAIFLVFIALYSIPSFDLPTIVIGIGGIVIGFIPFLLGKKRNHH